MATEVGGAPGASPQQRDPFDARLALHASGALREFNRAAVLSAADVHVARRLGDLGGERDESVLLAVALAVRAPRIGHVLVDLATIRETVAVDTEEPVDLESLHWPDPPQWARAVAGSPLVALETGDGAPGGEREPGDSEPVAVRPLRMRGSWLYLDRYWAEEVAVARALRARLGAAPVALDEERLAAGLARLFAEDRAGRQALATETAVRRPLTVIAGGPGTGKTTTVARIVALLCEQPGPAPRIALVAPTGKAAARLQESVQEWAAGPDAPIAPEIAAALRDLEASTIHRLLGWRPGSNSRFRHDRDRRLPHDVVIVDETSMVSLSLMARLIDALRAGARLVLVGDPGQLASIEAGAVLGDIVGGEEPAGGAAAGDDGAGGDTVGGAAAGDDTVGGDTVGGAATREAGAGATGGGRPAARDGIVVLDRGWRYGGGIAQLAAAIRGGAEDEVMELLRSGSDDVVWVPSDAGRPDAPARVRSDALAAAHAVVSAALAGDGDGALRALGGFRILCAHRRGPYGAASWNVRVEGWLQDALDGFSATERWYVGRPLIVTENDAELGVYNGDTGVVLDAGEGRVMAGFRRGSDVVRHSPSRLGAVDTVYAMTIHKSQGSQFAVAAVLLPEPGSRLLTRELLYTAATRAQKRLILVGPEETIRAAVARRVARASGLATRLWD